MFLEQSRQEASRAARTGAAIVTALALLALPAILTARDGQAGAPTPAPLPVAMPTLPPPLASGPIPDLELLFTSQVVGWIEPCG
jgi:hypothetical protein